MCGRASFFLWPAVDRKSSCGATVRLTALMFTPPAVRKRFSDVEDSAFYWYFVIASGCRSISTGFRAGKVTMATVHTCRRSPVLLPPALGMMAVLAFAAVILVQGAAGLVLDACER
jgi:hypothetical protein